ncbi:MAG: protein kinase [Verrucomicrobiota bacterium]
MKILVAEDDSVTRMVIASTLKSTGNEVSAFADGNSLWEACSKMEGPRILFLDWIMPGLSGLEICKRLDALEERSQVYVIMLSANDSVEDVVHGLDSGADDYLTKPVLRAELHARLRAAQRTLGYQIELAKQVHELKDTINGRYEPGELVGSGGLGSVYKGKDRLLQRPVAIKILNTALMGDGIGNGWDEALSEAMLTASICHHNIMSVYDCGQNAQGAFLVMELFEGQNLEQILDESGALSLSTFWKLAKEVLLGLKAAHDNNILHNDIKPSNIMVRPLEGSPNDLEIRILDFGLAKVRDQDDYGDDSECVMASIHYLSPEIIVGDPIDMRSDIYSLGQVFYHLLAGRPAYNLKTVDDMLRAHLKGDYENVRTYNREVPEQVSYWLDGMLEHDCDKRYQSVDEVLRVFQEIETECALV